MDRSFSAASDAVMLPPGKPIACILAMARATPPHCVDQQTYADFYFNITKTADKMPQLKEKFSRICEKSGVDTRFSILTEEFLRAHPEFYTPERPSLEERHEIFAKEIPKLAHEAGVKVIHDWGRPVSDITHLIVATLSGIAIPGADVALAKSLGLNRTVNRIMLYMLGCYAGVTALRIAKDIAENNPDARILICCCELSATTFRAPDERYTYDLMAAALFGDGASGVIVGAQNLSPPSANPNPGLPPTDHRLLSASPDIEPLSTNPLPVCLPWSKSGSTCHESNGNHKSAAAYNSDGATKTSSDPCQPNGIARAHAANMANSSSCSNGAHQLLSPEVHCRDAEATPNYEEKAIYEIHWAGETLIDDTEGIIEGKLKLDGLKFYLDRKLPSLVGEHVRPFCDKVLAQARNLTGGKGDQGLGFSDVFWAVHAGGPAILRSVEAATELQEGKMQASREILKKYGNVSASTVLFVLQELAMSPHLDACEWGLAVAFGPGVTIEGALLRRRTPLPT